MLRVHPALSAGFAGHHDATMRQALSQTRGGTSMQHVVSLPFSRGGGFGPSKCSSDSWADSHHMIQRRHPAVAGQILQEMSQPHVAGSHIVAKAAAREEGSHWIRGTFLDSVGGRSASCDFRSAGPASSLACQAMGGNRQQQIPCTLTSWKARSDHDWERRSRPLLRSQGGPLSGVPCSCFPTSCVGTFRFWTVPGHAPPSSLSSPSIFSQLLVWPSLGRLWPPPCSLCGGWNVGSSGFCLGVSRGGRCQGGHQHHGS